MPKAPTRRFSTAFKVQLCIASRAGEIGRREAQRAHSLSNSLIHDWLGRFDRGEYCPLEQLNDELRERREQHVAELERLVGRLTLEVDRLRLALARASAGNDNRPSQKARRAAG